MSRKSQDTKPYLRGAGSTVVRDADGAFIADLPEADIYTEQFYDADELTALLSVAETSTEPDFAATEIQLPYGDNTLANKIEVGHTISGVAFFLSRFGCDTCDLTQWGSSIIRTDEVYSIVERLELPFTEKETSKEISKLAKKGVLVKVKRGQYTAGKLQQMSLDDMTKAIRTTRPIKRT